MSCSICLDDINGENMSNVDNCKHVFCFDCIKMWCEDHDTCPVCRSIIDSVSYNNDTFIPKFKKEKSYSSINSTDLFIYAYSYNTLRRLCGMPEINYIQ